MLYSCMSDDISIKRPIEANRRHNTNEKKAIMIENVYFVAIATRAKEIQSNPNTQKRIMQISNLGDEDNFFIKLEKEVSSIKEKVQYKKKKIKQNIKSTRNI